MTQGQDVIPPQAFETGEDIPPAAPRAGPGGHRPRSRPDAVQPAPIQAADAPDRARSSARPCMKSLSTKSLCTKSRPRSSPECTHEPVHEEPEYYEEPVHEEPRLPRTRSTKSPCTSTPAVLPVRTPPTMKPMSRPAYELTAMTPSSTTATPSIPTTPHAAMTHYAYDGADGQPGRIPPRGRRPRCDGRRCRHPHVQGPVQEGPPPAPLPCAAADPVGLCRRDRRRRAVPETPPRRGHGGRLPGPRNRRSHHHRAARAPGRSPWPPSSRRRRSSRTPTPSSGTSSPPAGRWPPVNSPCAMK